MNVIFVQLLNNMINNEDHFKILRKIQKKPESSQRELAKELGDYQKAKNWFVDRQPMKRLGQPHEIAKLIIYLLSDDGSYATGQCHVIDGGSMG